MSQTGKASTPNYCLIPESWVHSEERLAPCLSKEVNLKNAAENINVCYDSHALVIQKLSVLTVLCYQTMENIFVHCIFTLTVLRSDRLLLRLHRILRMPPFRRVILSLKCETRIRMVAPEKDVGG